MMRGSHMSMLLAQSNPSVSVSFLHWFISGDPAPGGSRPTEITHRNMHSSFLMLTSDFLTAASTGCPPSLPQAWGTKGKFSLWTGCLLPLMSNTWFDWLLPIWRKRLRTVLEPVWVSAIYFGTTIWFLLTQRNLDLVSKTLIWVPALLTTSFIILAKSLSLISSSERWRC